MFPSFISILLMMSSASTSAAVAAGQRFDDALEKYLEEIVDPNYDATNKEIVDHNDKKEDKHYDLKRKREEAEITLKEAEKLREQMWHDL